MMPRILLSIVVALAASGPLATSQHVQYRHDALNLHEFGNLMTSLSAADGRILCGTSKSCRGRRTAFLSDPMQICGGLTRHKLQATT